MNTYSYGDPERRRQAIRDVIVAGTVRSQAELRRRLSRLGWRVAQPTLSRDLRELGILKSPGGYVAPGGDAPAAPAAPADAERRIDRLAQALRDLVLSVDLAGNLVILRTPPAEAPSLARSLDEAGLPELAGTIGGDDTVFAAVRGARAAAGLAARLEAVVDGRRKRP